MSHDVKYFDWSAGRPRWRPPKWLRDQGVSARYLTDTNGDFLPLYSAMMEAHALNTAHGIVENTPAPPVAGSAPAVQRGYVYFVVSTGFVKVGYSAKGLGRASDVSWSLPEPPTMVLLVPGHRKDEAAIHRLFEADRAQGEWFHASQKLLNLIVRCAHARAVVLATSHPEKAGPVSR